MGDATSINLRLGERLNAMAYVATHKLTIKGIEHNAMRQDLTKAHGSKLSASANTNLDQRLSPTTTSTASESKNDAEEEATQRSSQLNHDIKMTCSVRVTFIGCTLHIS